VSSGVCCTSRVVVWLSGLVFVVCESVMCVFVCGRLGGRLLFFGKLVLGLFFVARLISGVVHDWIRLDST
jgi:hypothetical protein